MQTSMASTRTSTRPSTRKPRTEGRKPVAAKAGGARRKDSLYAKAGEEGRREAQRKLLLRTLKEQGWHLGLTADALGMSGAPHVLRAIADVGLAEEYEAAKARGDITPGRRPG